MSQTIVAVGSPPGSAQIGIVRISGAASEALLQDVVPLPGARGVLDGRFRIDGLDLPCTVLWMPGPASYTGEDVAELLLPGNPLLLGRIVDRLIERGVQRGLSVGEASPGEFTYRAWSAGRMTLPQAEALMQKVHADTDAALEAAHRAALGALHGSVAGLAARCTDVLALVEGGIDFTDEEDVVTAPAAEVVARIDTLRSTVAKVAGGAAGRAGEDERPLIRLQGRPSAGKSTLFNALLGRERAVTMPSAHTTRDALVEGLELPDGTRVRLSDTPGSDDTVATSPDADLIVWCVPCGDSPPVGQEGLFVWTKADVFEGELDGLSVSAVTGIGMDALRWAMAESLSGSTCAASTAALSQRQLGALEGVDGLLHEASALAYTDAPDGALSMPECVAALLRDALDRLGSISGDVPPDDVLGVIFASFCVGK